MARVPFDSEHSAILLAPYPVKWVVQCFAT